MPPDDVIPADEKAYLDSRGAGVDAVGTPPPAEPAPPVEAPAPVEPVVAPVVAEPVAPAPAPATVPVSELAKERDRRRKAEAESARVAGQLEELRRLQGLAPKPAEAAPAAEPDVETDPIAALKAERAARQRVEARMAENEKAQREATEQNQRVNGLVGTLQTHEAEYAQAQPDYQAAAQHLIDIEHRELEAQGFTNPGERSQIIRHRALQMTQRAQELGQNVAQMIYGVAQARGYRQAPPQAAAAPQAAPAVPVAPQQLQAAPMPTEADKLAAASRGTDAARSLSNGAGAPAGTGKIDLKAIDKMSDAEFAKISNTPAFEKAMMEHYASLPR